MAPTETTPLRILVAGASRGLGLELARVLSERGDDVIATCRETTDALSALNVREIVGIDFAAPESAERLRTALGDQALDAVIYNAGINISFDAGIDELDLAALAREFDVNTIGAARAVQIALPRLRAGGRIVLVTTGIGASGHNSRSPGNYGYRMSKAALNTFGFLLATELEEREIAVRLVNPGPTDTDLLRTIVAAGRTPSGGATPSEVATDLVARLDELSLETTGTWVDRTGADIG